MPIIIKTNKKLNQLVKLLEKNSFFPRRYFYPSLNKINKLGIKENFKNSEYLSQRILCLPLYYGLKDQHIDKICQLINE